MKKILLAVVAATLLTSSIAEARSSGFSSSRSSSSSTFSSSRSSSSSSYGSSSRSSYGSYSSFGSSKSSGSSAYSSGSSGSSKSGFSSGSGSSSVGRAATATALGSTLYAAHASKSAADSYQASKAPAPAPTPTYAQSHPTYSAGYGAAPAPSTTVHHYHTYESHDSGMGNFVMGYLLGHASDRHNDRTVIVENGGNGGGYYPQPAQVYGNPGVPAGSIPADATTDAPAQAQVPATSVTSTQVVTPVKHGHPVLHFFAWLAGIGVVGFAGYTLLKNWGARKAKYTPTNHYKL